MEVVRSKHGFLGSAEKKSSEQKPEFFPHICATLAQGGAATDAAVGLSSGGAAPWAPSCPMDSLVPATSCYFPTGTWTWISLPDQKNPADTAGP